MANEADVLNRDGDIHYFTVADGNALNKGTLMILSADPRTAAAHSADGQIPLGFSVEEKVANDGQIKLGVRTRGIVDAVCDGNVTLGDLLIPGAVANRLRSAPAASLSNAGLRSIAGRALETGSDGEKIAVLLMCG